MGLMKKCIRTLAILVLIVFTTLSITGCTLFDRINNLKEELSAETEDKSAIDQTSLKSTSETLIEALNTKDIELFKSVFSEKTLNLQPDIDEGIEYIFNMYEGDYVETLHTGQSSESFSNIQANCIWAITTIKTTKKCYSLTWTEWTKQENDPTLKGVYSLTFEECEESQHGAGGGELLAGIYYSGCETEANVINVFFDAMHNKSREKLETILSDEFLNNQESVQNLDKFIEEYTPSYSNLLVAWKVNNTICIKLRGVDVYICLHLDSQYPDKISSIRVFNSADEDEESISEYNFEQDDVGIYLQN